jgi:hypothetical protein
LIDSRWIRRARQTQQDKVELVVFAERPICTRQARHCRPPRTRCIQFFARCISFFAECFCSIHIILFRVSDVCVNDANTPPRSLPAQPASKAQLLFGGGGKERREKTKKASPLLSVHIFCLFATFFEKDALCQRGHTCRSLSVAAILQHIRSWCIQCV